MKRINEQSVVGTALLVHVIIVIFILTLQPFNFQNPEKFQFEFDGNYPDIIRNIILFIPIGFFFRLARKNSSQGSALNILFWGASISLVIESCQLFLPSRYPAISDTCSHPWLVGRVYRMSSPSLDMSIFGRSLVYLTP